MSELLRADLARIASQIPPGSRVLDLGCGSGELLVYLMTQRGCVGLGIEHDAEAILAAVSAGVPVLDLDIDAQLDLFADGSFDVVVLSRTLQAVRHPVQVLRHMGRIGARLIVSMPNFAYWPHRLRLLGGEMPRSSDLPFDWFDSPNLHFATLSGMQSLIRSLGYTIERRLALGPSGHLITWLPNLRAGSAIYVVMAVRGGKSVS